LLVPLSSTLACLCLSVAAVAAAKQPAHGDSFTLTPEHIRLLRQATVLWAPIESGAPAVMVTPLLMEGASHEDVAADVARRAGIVTGETPTAEDRQRGAALLDEVPEALAQLMEHGTLAPGSYRFENRVVDLENAANLVPDELPELAKERTATFTFTAQHRALLAAARWSGPMVNPKRPYGDMSYFELDMLDVLGEKAPQDAQGMLAPAVEKRLGKLHAETMPALQLFLDKATIEPRAYAWVEVSPELH
jgi:hypothetical protein